MELKLDFIPFLMSVIIHINRTFMELKPFDMQIYKKGTAILIEPLWN
jgi:hypothetical protein